MSTDNSSPQKRHFAHHFKSADHEFKSSIFGVWLFLATEILMFGGLIVAYIIYSGRYPEVFAKGAEALDWRLGAFNTVVLLISSWTMVMGVRSAQLGKNKDVYKFCIATLVGGAIFLVVKYFEYSHKIHIGLLPGKLFNPDPVLAANFVGVENLAQYFSFYFMLTGLHGIHVVIGMALILWVALRARKGEFNGEYYTPVEGVGLFWHLVDMVWIYLFPILYLI